MLTAEQQTEILLRKRLIWIARTATPDLGFPPWLAALIAAYAAMDVDDPDNDAIGVILDRAEERLGLDPEATFDAVCQGWRSV
jgi:hypothetical protein